MNVVGSDHSIQSIQNLWLSVAYKLQQLEREPESSAKLLKFSDVKLFWFLFAYKCMAFEVLHGDDFLMVK